MFHTKYGISFGISFVCKRFVAEKFGGRKCFVTGYVLCRFRSVRNFPVKKRLIKKGLVRKRSVRKRSVRKRSVYLQ